MEEPVREIDLILEAYVKSCLDFKRSNRYNKKARAKESWILSYLEKQRLLSLYSHIHLQHSACTGASNKTTYEHHFNAANDTFESISNLLLPRDKNKKKKTHNIEDLKKEWEEMTGQKWPEE